MEFLASFTVADWRAVAGAVIAGLIVAAIIWFCRVAFNRRRLKPIGDTDKIQRPINNLPKPTSNYVEDKTLIVGIYQALKGRRGTTLTGLKGMGGIGKTEAAIVTAWHLLNDGYFKDGAVQVDLQGFAEGHAPMSAEVALGKLIALATGEYPPPRPDGMEEADFVAQLSGRWQHVTSGRDLLVILDNAASAEQIAPLMPGANGPRVLITSRVAIQPDGMDPPIAVGVLDDRQARALVTSLVPDLSAADRGRLIAMSLHLPLLLRTLSGTVKRPEKTASVWLTELEELGPAAAGEDVAAVRDRLAFSIDALGKDDAGRYAALSLCEAGFHAKSAYAIWDQDEIAGADTLRRLRDASLLEDAETPFAEQLGPRYRLHDYLAASAAERFGGLHWQTRRGFHHRWGQVALKLLATANQVFETKGQDLVGLRLFEIEQATIRAAQGWAVANLADDDVAADLAMRFPNFWILDLRLTPRERIGWLEAGLPAARRLGDRAWEAMLLGNAGHLYRMLGEFDAAEAKLTAALAIEEECGNRLGMARQHGNLGNLYAEQGMPDLAEEAYTASLEISGALSREAAERGDEAAQRQPDVASANTHGNLGIVYKNQEKFAEAEQSYRASLEITERLGMRQVSAIQYGNLGVLYETQGKLDAAAEAYEASLAISDEIGAKDVSANQRFNLAGLRLDQGQIAEARRHADRARGLFAEMGMDRDVKDADDLLAEITEAGG